MHQNKTLFRNFGLFFPPSFSLFAQKVSRYKMYLYRDIYLHTDNCPFTKTELGNFLFCIIRTNFGFWHIFYVISGRYLLRGDMIHVVIWKPFLAVFWKILIVTYRYMKHGSIVIRVRRSKNVRTHHTWYQKYVYNHWAWNHNCCNLVWHVKPDKVALLHRVCWYWWHVRLQRTYGIPWNHTLSE